MIVSPYPSDHFQQVFHYCINQTMAPRTNLEEYKRLDARGGYKAWFLPLDIVPPTKMEKEWLSAYATITYHGTLLERLLTVRSEWSKK